ncbi:MAG: secD [Frankiales bacterium]|nr:secD [Frankiales bacterium]
MSRPAVFRPAFSRPALSRPAVPASVWWRALLALAVVALSAFAAITQEPRLGLDLRGGTQIVLETQDSPTLTADAASTDRAVEVLRRRVDAIGVAEPTLARSGERRIIVELPGLQDPAEAAAVVGRTALLTFHPVLGEAAPDAPLAATGTVDTSRESVLPDEDGRPLRLGAAALTGEGVASATAVLDPELGARWAVDLAFRGDGDRAWERLTGAAACRPPGDPARRVAIVLDGAVISSPQVDPSVGCRVGLSGGTQITGSTTREQAQDLAALVQGGALPLPVEVVEQRVVGPTLGAEAIDASARAAVLGMALTAAFLVVVYRLVGLLAAVGLAAYGLVSYGTLVALGATLTLPGLAGLLLSAGLAIDANVLVFERAREEQAAGHPRGVVGALREGYARAWSAIADSNVTTLLAAGLLFVFASGPVRGFGVTLVIGVLASMVSALVVCRALTDVVVGLGAVRSRPALTGFATAGRVRTWLLRRDPHLMRHRDRWLAVSAVAVVLATSGIAVRGLDLGVEFTGGRLVEYSTSRTVSADVAREAVADAGFPRAVVQRSGDDDITVRTGGLTNAQEAQVRAAVAGVGGEVVLQRDELVGPTLGDELRTKALLALGLALAAQLVYLAARFRWTFGAGAVLAMLHDVLVVVGLFAWLGRPVDGVFLAAALTIVGVSVNDSIVTLDRVREVWTQDRTRPLERVCDDAVLQTAPRTVNTGLGAMFVLASLAVLGGDSLGDFALALLVGLVVGTWSSAFTATPLLLLLEARWGGRPPVARTVARRTGPGAARLRDSGAVL